VGAEGTAGLWAQQVVGGIAIGCIYSLIALGFSMIVRAMDLLNFAHGEVLMLGGMLGVTALVGLRFPYWATIVAVTAASAVVGAILEWVVFRPLRRHRAPLDNMIIATVGLGIFLRNGAILVWGADPVRYPVKYGEPLVLGPVRLPLENLWILGVGVAAMVLLQLFFARTKTGVAMRASAFNPVTARLMGIPVDRMNLYTFAIGSALAGLAGVLLAPLLYASFDMGSVGLKAFAAACLGGFGSVPGAIVGGLVLGVGETLGAFFVSTSYQDALAFGLLILLLLFRPSGLFGRPQRAV